MTLSLPANIAISPAPRGRALSAYIAISASISAALAFIIIITLAAQSLPAIKEVGPSLLGLEWRPSEQKFGLFPMVFGSFIVMSIAMALALPIGVLAAIYISQTRSDKLKRRLKATLEILAGIPSIVYGLLGVSFLAVFVQDVFDLQTGRVILTAGILLAVMILPTILSLTEDAISGVPKAVHQNAAALGLYPWEVFKDAIWPYARRDVYGAALLALGRALGETMAVMLVIGSLDHLPNPLLNVLSSGQSLTSKLGREVGESAFGSLHFSALIFAALILVTMTVSLTIAAQILLRKQARYV